MIVGNLTVSGQTTTIISNNTLIDDNLLVINSGPSGSRDSGVLIQRYQTDNDLSEGDVVQDTNYHSIVLPNQSSMTSTQIKFTSSESDIDNYYIG